MMRYLDLPPPDDQRIHKLYCWVVIHEDGSEGIAAAGTLPLITSKEPLAREIMCVAAEKVLALSAAHGSKRGVRIELRTFEMIAAVVGGQCSHSEPNATH